MKKSKEEVQNEEKGEERVIPEQSVQCPICGRLNSDNYPLIIDGDKVMGGCIKCWEFQCKEGTEIAKEILPESFFKNHSTPTQPEKEWKDRMRTEYYQWLFDNGDTSAPRGYQISTAEWFEDFIQSLLSQKDKEWEEKIEKVNEEAFKYLIEDQDRKDEISAQFYRNYIINNLLK
jgi:hypothetical protein